MTDPSTWPGSPFPDWLTSFRDTQVTAANEALQLFESGVDVVLMDAPTGSGKSLLAEMIGRGLGLRRTYVCHGLDLQDQFLGAFPESRTLKGRANYPTLDAPMMTAGDCQGQACGFCVPKAECPYIQARLDAMKAEVAVLNMTLLLTLQTSLFIRPFIILDECDQLEDQMMKYHEFRVTQRRFGELGIEPPTKASRKKTIRAWLTDQYMPAATDRLNELGEGQLFAETDVKVLRARMALKREIARAKDVARRLDDDWVRDYGYGKTENDLILKPVRVGNVGPEMLWDRGKARKVNGVLQPGTKWLCMSGTIISPDEWVESVGVEQAGLNWEVVTVPMTFPVANRPIAVNTCADMSKKGLEEGFPKAIERILTILDNHPGESTLIHTVSYDLMRRTVAALRDARVPDVISYEGANDRALALKRFGDKGGVIVAPSLDRGVDLPDGMCRVIIVMKMPFAYLGDRQVSERLYGVGGQLWYSVQTARKLVQMTGRAVRHDEDWAKVYILDNQFDKFYRQWGRKLLPRWWREGVVGK